MAKAMLIMDMPSSCDKCPAHSINMFGDICCRGKDGRICLSEKPNWCPVRECPTKKETKKLNEFLKDGQDEKIIENFVAEEFMTYGYNACIDEILGGGE